MKRPTWQARAVYRARRIRHQAWEALLVLIAVLVGLVIAIYVVGEYAALLRFWHRWQWAMEGRV